MRWMVEDALPILCLFSGYTDELLCEHEGLKGWTPLPESSSAAAFRKGGCLNFFLYFQVGLGCYLPLPKTGMCKDLTHDNVPVAPVGPTLFSCDWILGCCDFSLWDLRWSLFHALCQTHMSLFAAGAVPWKQTQFCIYKLLRCYSRMIQWIGPETLYSSKCPALCGSSMICFKLAFSRNKDILRVVNICQCLRLWA